MPDYATNRAALERRVFRRRMLGIDDAGLENGWGTMSGSVVYYPKGGGRYEIKAIVDDSVALASGEQVVAQKTILRVTVLRDAYEQFGVPEPQIGDMLVVPGDPPGVAYGFDGEVLESTSHSWTLVFTQYRDVHVGALINARDH